MIAAVLADGAVEAFNKEVPQQKLEPYDMILEARRAVGRMPNT